MICAIKQYMRLYGENTSESSYWVVTLFHDMKSFKIMTTNNMWRHLINDFIMNDDIAIYLNVNSLWITRYYRWLLHMSLCVTQCGPMTLNASSLTSNGLCVTSAERRQAAMNFRSRAMLERRWISVWRFCENMKINIYSSATIRVRVLMLMSIDTYAKRQGKYLTVKTLEFIIAISYIYFNKHKKIIHFVSNIQKYKRKTMILHLANKFDIL